VYVKLSNINYYIFMLYLVNHGLWQYRTGSTGFLWLLTVRAHGQYNHRCCVVVSLTQTKKKGLDLKKKLVEDVSIYLSN